MQITSLPEVLLSSMSVKVCAIIVTRNRLKSLQKTIHSLLQQTFPIYNLIVVDNDSTDGTKDFLKSLSIPVRLQIIFQSNLGGAGGFNAGLALFRNSEAEWCWLMDDDGWADCTALEYLKPENTSGIWWRNSLVLNESNTNELAFSLCADGVWTNDKDIIISAERPIHTCNPFNGTLLHKSLVDDIGLPISQFFIKGDETEYQRRAQRYGYITETYVNSIFYHPAIREHNVGNVPDSRVWIYYYKVRNINAFGDRAGHIRFDKKASFTIAKEYTAETVTSYLGGKLKLKGALIRLWIIWSGVVASCLNHPFRWYIPCNK